MGKRLIISESDKARITNLYSKPLIKDGYGQPLNETVDVDNMVESGIIDKDIVPLPPNDIFDPNVFGSYHWYKIVHYTFLQTGMLGGKNIMPVAYYKVPQEIVDNINKANAAWKAKYKDSHIVKGGHWRFSKKNPGMIELISYNAKGPDAVSGPLSYFKTAEGVIGTIPAPKGIKNIGQLQWGESWFFDNSMQNVYFEFFIWRDQADAYIKLMEEVVKVKDIPDPDTDNKTKPTTTSQPAQQPSDAQQPMNEGKKTKNVVKLTETQLRDLIKRIVNESVPENPMDDMDNLEEMGYGFDDYMKDMESIYNEVAQYVHNGNSLADHHIDEIQNDISALLKDAEYNTKLTDEDVTDLYKFATQIEIEIRDMIMDNNEMDAQQVSESKIKKVIRKKLSEDVGEEPVIDSDGNKHRFIVYFEEGQTKLSSSENKRINDDVAKYLRSTQTVATLSKYYKTGKLPKFIKISVGTSHTGAPQTNANVAQARLNYLSNVIANAFAAQGINADIIKQFIITNTNTEYKPSELDTQFYDKTKIAPKYEERIAVINFEPLTVKGLNTSGIQNVQGKLNDASGYVSTDEDGVVKAIDRLETYSDIIDLDAALKAQRKWNGLEAFINNQLNDWGGEDDFDIMSIAQHLNNCAKTSGKQKAVRLYSTPNGYKISIDLSL